ncbi:copper-transporting ATPase 1-like [Saccoglossus kowalevskii]|uniref:Copper-transporting ATPase 1-like n=1 Tax=Saccoglossus kowalevskii TaxID=10224 RepID=A0ABM0MQS2_SACKO|nr:PREDICTED: copper-transporting ATPase 1-like [Saccoglossus kowalevskii]
MSHLDSVAVIRVRGMKSVLHAEAIKSTLTGQPGVKEVSAFLNENQIHVIYRSDYTTTKFLQDSIAGIRYDSLVVMDKPRIMYNRPMQYNRMLPPKTANIYVHGIMCLSCVAAIQRQLTKQDGVRSADVSLKKKRAQIEYFPDQVSHQDLQELIHSMGYDARMEDQVELEICALSIEVPTCASVVLRHEKELMKREGIESVHISFMTGKAEVKYNPAVLDPSQIAEMVGYKSTVDEVELGGTLELMVA